MEGKKEIHFSQDKEPKSACDVLNEMLSNHPLLRTEYVRGGGGIGMSTSGNLVAVPRGGSNITSYDQDTNSLLRAKFACHEGMVVSPLSTNRHTLFVKPEQYEDHVKRAETIAKENEPTYKQNCAIQ